MSAAEVESFETEKKIFGIELSKASAIGVELKKKRESLALEIPRISHKIKITERFIAAMESGNWDTLPPGLHGRGLLRLYCRELNVIIPELNQLGSIQSPQADKISEKLAQLKAGSNTTKYQPAAQEAAVMVRVVSRQEFEERMEQQDFATHNILTNTDASIINQPHSKTHPTAPIVTTKISEILGIEINEENESQNQYNLHLVVTPKETIIQQPKIEITPKPIAVKKMQNHDTHSSKNNSQKEIPVKKNFSREWLLKMLLEKKKTFFQGTIFFIVLFSVALIVRHLSHGDTKQKESSVTSTTLSKNPQFLEASQKLSQKIPDQNSAIFPTNTPPNLENFIQNSINTSVERAARLQILSRVKIEIVVDGKNLFSGYHPAGNIEFTFKEFAKIIVFDASKVKLTYGPWDQGELGWNERKRKIILNARPFEE